MSQTNEFLKRNEPVFSPQFHVKFCNRCICVCVCVCVSSIVVRGLEL